MKNCKGITLISLIITITLMVIISGVTVSVSMDRFKINNVKKMQNDIQLLNNKVEAYYLKYGGLPVLRDNSEIKYTYSELDFNKNVNDNENYYIIDFGAIGNITLNYGKEGYENPNVSDDVYIINEKTHTVYYVKGIEFKDGTVYHSLALDNTHNTNEIGPARPEIKILTENDNSSEIEIIPGKDSINSIGKTVYTVDNNEYEINERTVFTLNKGIYNIAAKTYNTKNVSSAETNLRVKSGKYETIAAHQYLLANAYGFENFEQENSNYVTVQINGEFEAGNYTIFGDYLDGNNIRFYRCYTDTSNRELFNGQQNDKIDIVLPQSASVIQVSFRLSDSVGNSVEKQIQDYETNDYTLLIRKN